MDLVHSPSALISTLKSLSIVPEKEELRLGGKPGSKSLDVSHVSRVPLPMLLNTAVVFKGPDRWAPQMGIFLVGLTAGNIWFDF